MQSRNVYRLCLMAVLAVAIMLSCSGAKNNSTEPQTPVVTMTGSVTLPYYADLGYDQLTVGFGDHDESIAEDGTFAIDGNEHVPGLAVVRDAQGIPILMAIVPDPTAQTDFTVDVRSTAVALAFLHPFVCTNNSDDATDVLNALGGLSETTAFEYLIENQFAYTNLALAVEDDDLIDALTAVVMAYVNSYPEQMPIGLAKPGWRTPSTPVDDDGVQIYPNGETSGLQLTGKGGSTFEISNRFGRWAYCTTPTDSFLIYPNGDFLDVIKDGKPWQPSKRTFTMNVAPNSDTSFVRVYSYGFASWNKTKWDDLTPKEQRLVHTGGVATITVELAAQMLSVITN